MDLLLTTTISSPGTNIGSTRERAHPEDASLGILQRNLGVVLGNTVVSRKLYSSAVGIIKVQKEKYASREYRLNRNYIQWNEHKVVGKMSR